MRSFGRLPRFVLAASLLFVGGAGCGGKSSASPDGHVGPAPDARPADAAPPTGALAIYQPAPAGQGQTWGDLPYPSDLFLDGAGLLTLKTLPIGNPANVDPAAVQALTDSLHTMDGAGIWSSAVFPIRGDLDEATLAGHVHMVELPDAHTDVLVEVPTDLVWRPDLHAIVLAPKLGTLLRESTRYGAYLTDDIKATDGTPLAADAAFAAAAADGGPAADLIHALSTAGTAPAHVVVATVFTTEHVTRDAKAMRDVAVATPPVIGAVTQVFSTPAELDGLFGAQDPAAPPGGDDSNGHRGEPHGHIAVVLHGTFGLPNFLSSSQTIAGFMQKDAAGKPIIQSTSTVRWTLTLPKVTTGTYKNTPVILYAHGIGRTRQDLSAVADSAASHGFAVFAIDHLYHGDRAIGATDQQNDVTGATTPDGFGDNKGLLSSAAVFHLSADTGPVPAYHPRAMRENLRQAAIDLCATAAFLERGDFAPIDAALTALDSPPTDLSFRPGVAILTESFGGMVSGISLALDPNFSVATLSVAAAGFPFPSMLHSPSFSPTFAGVVLDPFDVASRTVLGDAKKGAHIEPIVMLFNSVMEQADPSAFGRALLDGSLRGDAGPSVLMAEVWSDETVPNEATEHLAGIYGAQRVVLAAPMAPPDPVNRFVNLATAAPGMSGNIDGGTRTIALSVWFPSTHAFLRLYSGHQLFMPGFPPFVKRPTPLAIDPTPIALFHAQWASFFTDSWAGRVPVVIDPYTGAN